MKPFISVVIPAHNEEAFIADCLDAISNQDYPKERYEVIVVDNNSTDGTSKIIQSFKNVRYFFKKEGPVGAVRNFGVKHAHGEFIAFIDADCVAQSDWLTSGAALLEAEPAGAFGGRSMLPPDAPWIEKYWILGTHPRFSGLNLIGATIFIAKEKFWSIGGFSETVTSSEDSLLSEDLRRSGRYVSIEKSLNVIHLGNAKSVLSFIKRQEWHSENYFKKPASSLRDPTFWLTIFFTVSALILVTGMLMVQTTMIMGGLIIMIGCANLLTAKRVLRSEYPRRILSKYLIIHVIDYLYLAGRTIGLIKGLSRSVVS